MRDNGYCDYSIKSLASSGAQNPFAKSPFKADAADLSIGAFQLGLSAYGMAVVEEQ